jgi:hypothetical protein
VLHTCTRLIDRPFNISYLIKYKAKEERGGEKREVLAKTTKTLA